MQSSESILRSWDSRSAVRGKPRRTLDEVSEGQTFFPVKLTPIVTHPIVAERGSEKIRELLTRRLFQYLDFTTILEQEIVNPVVLRLSRDAYGLDLPDSMKLDAYRIYCDEAYHALFSADVKRQVEQYSTIRSTQLARPRFEIAIGEAKSRMPSALHGLIELCAAFVSETLISGTLTVLPADPSVVTVIRESIADHAADERTHHAYFTRVFDAAWGQLDGRVREQLGPCIAEFIVAFLYPDLKAQQELLQHAGFGDRQAAAIVDESHGAEELIAYDVRRAARYTLGTLRRNHVLDIGATEARFVQLKLIQ